MGKTVLLIAFDSYERIKIDTLYAVMTDNFEVLQSKQATFFTVVS